MDLSNDCTKCRFAFAKGVNKQDLRKIFECRRNPPLAQILPSPQGAQTVTFFPTVNSETGCGQFETAIAIAH
jgi:hypothetical protein